MCRQAGDTQEYRQAGDNCTHDTSLLLLPLPLLPFVVIGRCVERSNQNEGESLDLDTERYPNVLKINSLVISTSKLL